MAISATSVSHVKWSRSVDLNTEIVWSEHIHFSSFLMRTPTRLSKYFLVVGQFNTSITNALLLRLATALPMCFLAGVSKNFLVTFLYSKLI